MTAVSDTGPPDSDTMHWDVCHVMSCAEHNGGGIPEAANTAQPLTEVLRTMVMFGLVNEAKS